MTRDRRSRCVRVALGLVPLWVAACSKGAGGESSTDAAVDAPAIGGQGAGGSASSGAGGSVAGIGGSGGLAGTGGAAGTGGLRVAAPNFLFRKNFNVGEIGSAASYLAAFHFTDAAALHAFHLERLFGMSPPEWSNGNIDEGQNRMFRWGAAYVGLVQNAMAAAAGGAVTEALPRSLRSVRCGAEPGRRRCVVRRACAARPAVDLSLRLGRRRSTRSDCEPKSFPRSGIRRSPHARRRCRLSDGGLCDRLLIHGLTPRSAAEHDHRARQQEPHRGCAATVCRVDGP